MRRGTTYFLLVGLLFLICCSMTACSGSSESRQPDAAFPTSYRGAVSSSVSGTAADTAMALLPYRRFFADQTLRRLIDTAMVHNIDLQMALKNIDYAQQTLHAAKLAALPGLNLVLQNVRTSPSDNGVKTTVQDYNASVTASWEIDIWGKIRSRKKSALASYLKTQEAAKAVQTRLVADVSTGYYNLLMLDAQLAITKNNLALADTTLKMIQFQYTAGQVNDLAIKQQEASRQSIALSIPVIEENIAVQENALSILCGRMPGAIHRDRSLFIAAKVVDDLPTGIPSAMLQNRPDVRAAELAVRVANADMDEAQATMYPSLVLTAQGGLDSFTASEWFRTPGSLFGLLQGAVLQPLFQRGQLKAKYEQSKIMRDQSELEFKQSVLKAVSEVSDALVRLEKIKVQELIAEERVTTLHKALSNVGMLFQSGMVTYLEVIVVQNNALSAELTLADIRRQHLAAMAELYRSLGGGWR